MEKRKATSTAKRKTSSKALNKASTRKLTDEARRQRIAETAYYIAQAQGFIPGRELSNWLEAERAIDAG